MSYAWPDPKPPRDIDWLSKYLFWGAIAALVCMLSIAAAQAATGPGPALAPEPPARGSLICDDPDKVAMVYGAPFAIPREVALSIQGCTIGVPAGQPTHDYGAIEGWDGRVWEIVGTADGRFTVVEVTDGNSSGPVAGPAPAPAPGFDI